MVNEIYPFSVFYIPYTTFERAGEKFSIGQGNSSWSFLFKVMLMNLRYKKHLGTSITFTTSQIAELIKSVEYENLSGVMVTGKNMVEAEEDEVIRGDKNYRLLQFANNKNVDMKGEVKIICDDPSTKAYFEKAKLSDDYPIDVISSDEALEELIEIEKKIKEKWGF